ncbi:MAG: outer membrane protein [Bradyrhizobium sp.]
MKKLLLTLSAMALFTGSASAADLGAGHMYTKAAPMAAPAYSWTGFYIFGGAGGGLWDAKGNTTESLLGVSFATRDSQTGGNGWFGTVGAGYDWQFNSNWVAGVFADAQFGSIRGSLTNPLLDSEGSETLRDSWAAGARFGYLVAPNVLSYVNAGYTGSQWSGTSLTGVVPVLASLATTPSFSRDGWFIGGGVENSLDIFGVHIPGLFMKTEYRAAYYARATLPETIVTTPVPVPGLSITNTFKPIVQTISTSLVYRVNWGGPVVAKY